MSNWSETMFTIQHFYNAFDIDKRLGTVESKIPLIAKNSNGSPENIIVENLKPGTIWLIEENDSFDIKYYSILTRNGTFTEPIPLGVEWD